MKQETLTEESNITARGKRSSESNTFYATCKKLLQSIKPSKLKKRSWRTKAAFFLIFASILSCFATYAALTETPPFGSDPELVIWLLNLDLVILLLLAALIARRIVSLWSGRKRGLAGSHLHVRLVYVFSLLAAVPMIIMTIFSAFFFHFGIQTWFSERVQTAINESQAVARSYLEEHRQVIRADTLAMANDLDRQADILVLNEDAFATVMETQSSLRNLPEAIVFMGNGRVIARSGLTFSLEFNEVPTYALEQAQTGDVVLMTAENQDRVRALVKLNNFNDAYLFVGRMVDPQVLSHLTATDEAVSDYANLQASYSGLQITVTMIFVVVGLLMLFAAIWFGIILARQLVTPISELISAADHVRGGDLTFRIKEEKSLEEFEFLAKSFNRMTQQIQQQRDELIQANRQIDRRRRLIETVLAGVTSGVIGADESGTINLANASAASLLNISVSALTGRDIFVFLPELKDLLNQAQNRPGKITQAEIQISRHNTGVRTFLFRVAIELIGEEDKGYILTFDDITELQSAQRKAAWSDVARRIAHEIKNPLTPIQLSAERLRKKYLSQITTDPDTFSQCTETIIKHVGDIGRMVDEFSSFARMPEPVLKEENLFAQIRESLVLPIQAHPNISFKLITGMETDKSLRVDMDSRQIRQAMTNLVQNSVDAVSTKLSENPQQQGRIDILLSLHGEDEVFIAITDNGIGLPKDVAFEKLAEPYVTHKPKGTGLGLAIVKKIMEDHHGRLVLGPPDWIKNSNYWTDLGGATVTILLPLKNAKKTVMKLKNQSDTRNVA